MRRVSWTVELKMQGPLITKSSAIGRHGVDAVMAQSSFVSPTGDGKSEKRYFLPGTLVKGLLREGWQELAAVEKNFGVLIDKWLGEKSHSGQEPERGKLVFNDFVDWQTPTGEAAQRYRIEIDATRGAVDAGQMQVLDAPYAPGQEIRFNGVIRALVSDEFDVSPIRKAVEQGLNWIASAGGVRSCGFGRVLGASLQEQITACPTCLTCPTPDAPAGTWWDIRFQFQSLLIFSKRRISDNLFESDDVIPGAAVKGALASMMAVQPDAFGALHHELHGLRITHAFPALCGATRPKHFPMSLVLFDEQFEDVIRMKQSFVRDGKVGKFDIDWKREKKEDVLEAHGWPKPEYETRVRTAIEGEFRRQEDEKLFAWKMLVPHERDWVASVSVANLSQEARGQLCSLLQLGPEPLGKSKALALCTVDDKKVPQIEHPAASYIVTLQTSALLIDPSRYLAPNGGIGITSKTVMEAEFQEAWSQLSDGSLALENYFQRCSLAGGEYLLHRFKPLGQKQYKPFLLTDAGSTFLLRPTPGRETEALAAINLWLARGLPLRASVAEFYGLGRIPEHELWKYCSYLPENGFGEVAVNAPCPYPEAA